MPQRQGPIYPQVPPQTHAQETGMEGMFTQFMERMDAKFDQWIQSSQTSIHKLEVQVNKLVEIIIDMHNTEANFDEGAMAITTRSGRVLETIGNEKKKEPQTQSAEKKW